MRRLGKGSWVLVADGEKALFLRNKVDALAPVLQVVRIEEQDSSEAVEQSGKRPGRMADTGPGHRSALEFTDWHQLAKDRFAEDLADILYKQAHKAAFSRLVIVAPPRTLGELRDKLHPSVKDRVIAEIDKTLTNHPIDEIAHLVRQELSAER